jgi:hypothetical protein
MSSRLQKMMLLLGFGIALVLFSGVSSFAAVEFNVAAIEAQITAAIAAGEEPEVAAKGAVVNAVKDVKEANADYPGGPEALNLAILDALAGLNITGLDTADTLLTGNHALGLQVDTALEAYEAEGGQGSPGERGRTNAGNHGGNAYGPGGKPQPGSPT